MLHVRLGTHPGERGVEEQWFDGEVDGGANADAFLARARKLAPAALGGRVDRR